MATAVDQARPVVMRDASLASTTSQTVKEVACILLLLLVALMYVFAAHQGPAECVGIGSQMDSWVQPTAVFLLGGQLAIFHNLGLTALM
jgi:hypothetical protein